MGNSTKEEGKFLSHQPCPRCGSKDNLAVYSDGHSYCFGCHYYIKSGLIKSSNGGYTRTTTGILENLRPLQSSHLLYLKQYNLTNKEIEDLNVCWSESTGLLIFPQTIDGILVGYIGRRFQGQGSKYVIRGEKKKFTKIYGCGRLLVFTEDLISAVKVARVTSSLPLFGTNCASLPEGYNSYRLWLDKDKQISSIQQCRKWRQYGYDIQPIITDLDPKDYSTEEIQKWLTNAVSDP